MRRTRPCRAERTIERAAQPADAVSAAALVAPRPSPPRRMRGAGTKMLVELTVDNRGAIQPPIDSGATELDAGYDVNELITGKGA